MRPDSVHLLPIRNDSDWVTHILHIPTAATGLQTISSRFQLRQSELCLPFIQRKFRFKTDSGIGFLHEPETGTRRPCRKMNPSLNCFHIMVRPAWRKITENPLTHPNRLKKQCLPEGRVTMSDSQKISSSNGFLERLSISQFPAPTLRFQNPVHSSFAIGSTKQQFG